MCTSRALPWSVVRIASVFLFLFISHGLLTFNHFYTSRSIEQTDSALVVRTSCGSTHAQARPLYAECMKHKIIADREILPLVLSDVIKCFVGHVPLLGPILVNEVLSTYSIFSNSLSALSFALLVLCLYTLSAIIGPFALCRSMTRSVAASDRYFGKQFNKVV